MKIMRMVCGIICCCLFLVIVFQSCAAGIGNALADSGEVSGSAGFITAVFMLVAGIISIAGRKSKGATITALVFYVLAGIIACTMYGSFSDLQIYGVLNFIFAGLFFISLFIGKKKKEITVTEAKTEE